MTSPEAIRPLFIVGCYRSGTSLVRLMLNEHAGIHVPLETRFLSLALRSGSPPEPTAAGYEVARRALARHGWEWVPAWQDLPGQAQGSWPDLLRWICLESCPAQKRPGLRYWGDKTPSYVMLIPYLASAFPEARFIHVVRDGRDVAASVLGLHMGGAANIDAAALEWTERLAAGMVGERLCGPDRFLTLRYEDLVRSPEATVGSMCRFLGVAYDPDMLRFFEGHAAGVLSARPHQAAVAHPVNERRIGAFRGALTPAQVARFEEHASALLVGFGYELSGPFAAPPSNVGRYAGLSGNLVRLLWRRVRGGLGRGSRPPVG